jgi:hypothetical protein
MVGMSFDFGGAYIAFKTSSGRVSATMVRMVLTFQPYINRIDRRFLLVYIGINTSLFETSLLCLGKLGDMAIHGVCCE